MRKKIIITGVTGQDGSYMADFILNSTDLDVFGMVRRASKPDYSNLKNALKNKSKFSIHFIFLTWLKNQNQTELM